MQRPDKEGERVRVEGLDPLVLNQVQSQTSTQQVQTTKGIRVNTERKEQQGQEELGRYSYDRVAKSVEQVNKALEAFNIQLRFELNVENDELYVYVIDSEGKVIRRIPPESILEIASRMQQMVGLILDALI